MGKLKSLHLSGALNIRGDIEISQRRVMGVRLPIVDTNFEEHPPYYSPLGTSFWIDDATQQFKEALSLMGRFAELKVSIMRLAREVRRTVRKVNALEKVAIPELEESVKVIAERLEENEREMFVLMKMVKDRLSRKER
jgi:V/A-type H+-transporting ATPase subunit D